MRLALVLSLCFFATRARAQDADSDRVPDARDLCPDARETASTLLPGDGCPDTDGDHDGIVDDYDVCPSQRETVNGFHDLDGCPDDPHETPRAPSGAAIIDCFDGAMLVDVRRAGASTTLVPRADAPTWLGTTPLDCYAGVFFDGRRAVHCATTDVEATLVMRALGDRSAIGVLVVRSAHGLDRRAWSGTALAPFDPATLRALVDAHGSEIDACYDAEAAHTPSLAGRVTVVITASMTGALDVRVTDTLSPARPAVGTCIQRVIAALVLPTPPSCGAVSRTIAYDYGPE